MRIAEHWFPLQWASHHKKRIGRDISRANPWYLIDKMTVCHRSHRASPCSRRTKTGLAHQASYTFTGFRFAFLPESALGFSFAGSCFP